MERVAFLIEETDERLSCLLNPNTLVMRRHAGVVPRRAGGAKLTQRASSDDPLLFTGGGTTELELDLLFDVDVSGSSLQSEDVRDLTRPLWNLAENRGAGDAYGHPPLARFVWGKAWNIPGVVTAVAERLEHFDRGGFPRRSWLRMRFVRVAEPGIAEEPEGSPLIQWVEDALETLREMAEKAEQVVDHLVAGGGGAEGGERLDDLAWRYLGDPAAWRILAEVNEILNPLSLPPNLVLRVPLLGRGRAR